MTSPSPQVVRGLIVSSLLAGAIAACGSEAAPNGEQNQDALTDADQAQDSVLIPDIVADADTVDPVPDAGRDGSADSGDIGDTTPDGGNGPGAPCTEDFECASELCIFIASGADTGLCSELCADDAGCPDGSDCLVLSNSGNDAIRVCVPRDYCLDTDDDEYGVGPGCRGQDCNDEDPGVNVGAAEVCDGKDNDCDGEVDQDPTDAGLSCETGFAGACEAGTLVCELGSLTCVGTRTPVAETCNLIDDDCDGSVDNEATDAPVWYRDTDGDQYGLNSDNVTQCTQPARYVAAGNDCDDTLSTISPTAAEICDGVDNNCDGNTDEGDAIGARTWYADTDEDGFGDPDVTTRACDQPEGYVADTTDCDDERDDVYPDAPEVCDTVDNDCDGEVDEGAATDAPTWYRDADSDDFGTVLDSIVACSAPDGYIADGTDCRDDDENAYPGAPERCNGRDNNCDGFVDEGGEADDAPLWYVDADVDTYGSASTSTRACVQPDGYVANSDDCNDAATLVNPMASEVCDGIDNNCDGVTDPETSTDASVWYRDSDSDTWGNPVVSVRACSQPVGHVSRAGDCRDNNGAINPDAVEVCDRLDNNCDDVIDPATSSDARTWYRDADEDTFGTTTTSQVACFAPAGFVSRALDCDDGNDQVNPEAIETCNGIDDDCDGRTDPAGSFGELRWYADSDGDTFGNPSSSRLACAQPTGFVSNALDCRDDATSINPSATEVCDNTDNNCNGQIDEDLRRTCYGGPAGTADVGSCRSGGQTCAAGVWGSCVGELRPNSELCDGLDNDCDNTVDNIPVVVEGSTYTTLNNAHELCDGINQRFSTQCNAAIHRTCAARACIGSGFGAIENDGNIANIVCVPGGQVTVREVAWPQLTAIQPGCDGQTNFFGLSCNSAMHRWCQAQGLTTGWGPVERNNAHAYVSCAPRATVLNTTFTTLSTYIPGCNGSGTSGRFSLDCNAAISRHCAAQGFASGWGPIEHDGDSATIACLPSR